MVVFLTTAQRCRWQGELMKNRSPVEVNRPFIDETDDIGMWPNGTALMIRRALCWR